MDYKPLPIGVEDFAEIIEKGYYYVDKTLFIKELIDEKEKVNLFTRPRRFGKSLNISMIQYFFEKGRDGSRLFNGLKIADAGERYRSEMNNYPVIKVTFKAADKSTFQSSINRLKAELVREFVRHDYLLSSESVKEVYKILYKDIMYGTADLDDYSGSLRLLSESLEQHYGKKAIVLIDEYDVPLEKSYFNGYYKEMLNFIRALFDEVLKTNSSLNFAVLTGCLRVSKESIFTGLNNPSVVSIISDEYDEHFGFTIDETEKAFTDYQFESKIELVKKWYDGYVFGQTRVYNPWSIIKYLRALKANANKFPVAYWSNTSSNDIIRYLIEISNDNTKKEIEGLIHGRSIMVPVREEIVYEDIKQSKDNLWNFLFFTGYLKKSKELIDKNGDCYLTMEIPNEEVRYIYRNRIREWFEEKVKIVDAAFLLNAILEGDVTTITKELNKRLMSIISFHDSAENFYHGFLLGILSNVQGYTVKSNRESGNGRSDIFMKNEGVNKKAVIFKCKALKENENAEEKCLEALRQIEEKQYTYELEEEGYQVIQKYGISFRGKECMIR